MAYTPYGGGDGLESALDARDLTGEGMTDPTQRSYEAALYPVEESYLLQQQLAQAETDSRLPDGGEASIASGSMTTISRCRRTPTTP